MKLRKAKDIGIMEELVEIKKLIDVDKMSKVEAELNQLKELYEKSMTAIEEKIIENERLHNINTEQSEKLMRTFESSAKLEEKIRFLESSITIYEKELTERKELCSSLIEQKTSTEKEILQLRKIKGVGDRK